jgi:hypothetical protein
VARASVVWEIFSLLAIAPFEPCRSGHEAIGLIDAVEELSDLVRPDDAPGSGFWKFGDEQPIDNGIGDC